MREFTMDELCVLIRQVAGETADLGVAAADVSYADLGYDSLALLEVSARVRQELGVQLPEEATALSATPAQTVAQVNRILADEQVGAA